MISLNIAKIVRSFLQNLRESVSAPVEQHGESDLEHLSQSQNDIVTPVKADGFLSLIKRTSSSILLLLSYLNPFYLFVKLFKFIKNMFLGLYKFVLRIKNEFKRVELDLEAEFQSTEFKSKLEIEEIKLKYELKFKKMLISNLGWVDWVKYQSGAIPDFIISSCVDLGMRSLLSGSSFNSAKNTVISAFNSLLKK